MNLYMLPLLCFLLLSSPIDGRVYLKETFSTAKSLQSWILPVEPEHLGIFKHSRRTKDYSEFEGIYTDDTFKYYRMTRKSAPFANLNKTLIFQYEFQYPSRYECGGGYLKLLNVGYEALHFTDQTPYAVLFGADVCGFNRTILLELRHGGKLHKWKKRGTFPGDENRHLLTLLLFSNDTYAVNLDMETIAGGRLIDDFTEFPPEFIYNASVAKPADWDDKEFYEDPSDRKPVYWEDEKIPDPDFDPYLTQGLDSEPWDIPTVENPHRIYEWQPRRLRNPRYMGLWLGQRMENPNFSTSLHDLGVIGGVAFDIWQPYAGVLFDNILLTDDEAYAEKFALFTWGDYRRYEKDKTYEDKLYTYSMTVGSALLAKTKLDPRDAMSAEEVADLKVKHNRPNLGKNGDSRKQFRRKLHATKTKPFPGTMTKRQALEAFLDVDCCYGFETKAKLWKNGILRWLYATCPLKRRTHLRPLRE